MKDGRANRMMVAGVIGVVSLAGVRMPANAEQPPPQERQEHKQQDKQE